MCPIEARAVEYGVLVDIPTEPLGDLSIAPKWAMQAGIDGMYQRRLDRRELHRHAPRYWELCTIGPYRPPQQVTGHLVNLRLGAVHNFPHSRSHVDQRERFAADVSVEWLAAHPILSFPSLLVTPPVLEVLRPHLQTPFLCTADVELSEVTDEP